MERINMRYRGPVESKKYNQQLLQVKKALTEIKNKMSQNYNRIQDLSTQYYSGQTNPIDLYKQVMRIQTINQVYQTMSSQLIDKEI